MPKHPDGAQIARQAFAAGLREPEPVIHAGEDPVSRRALTAEELELVVDAFLEDLEELVVAADWSGTELVSLVLGVAYRLFAAIEDPDGRVALWRQFAAQIESRLTPDAEVH